MIASGANRRGLSAQEIACLTLLMDGKSNKEIAKALELSPATVASYLKAVYRKLGVQSRTHAVAIAIGEGIVEFDPKNEVQETAPRPSNGVLR